MDKKGFRTLAPEKQKLRNKNTSILAIGRLSLLIFLPSSLTDRQNKLERLSLYIKTSCFELIKFTTEDTKVKHTSITAI